MSETTTLPAPPGLLARALRFLDDRWNAILVKEVRQSLRGKTFRLTFFGTLAAATIAALAAAANMGSVASAQESMTYVSSVYLCLAVALLGIVPFSAFQSTAAEWEDDTFELLALSSLSPRRIVLGKLQSAGVQHLLFLSIFGPFLAVAVLLRGVDVGALLVVIGFTLLLAVVQTAVAIALSTVSRHRFARVVLMVALGMLVSFTMPLAMSTSFQFLTDPSAMRRPEFLASVIGMIAIFGIVFAYSLALASNMLAHPEENRSTSTRVVTTAGSVLMLLVLTWIATTLPGAPREMVSAMGISGLVIVTAVALFLTTERRGLGRRVTHDVPRSGLVALLAAPWLPGGGRGALLHVMHVGLIVVWILCLQETTRGPGAGVFQDGMGAFTMAALYALVYGLLAPGLLARFCDRAAYRPAVRLAIPLVGLLGVVGPAIAGVVLRDRDLQRLEHVGNPFWVLAESWNVSGWFDYRIWLPLAAAATLALVVNLPRMALGVLEVLRASRAAAVRHEERSHGARAAA